MPYTADDRRYQTMLYRRSGNSGLKLPLVSLGMWHNFGTYENFGNMRKLCLTAFDHGITHFDLANNYGPERGSAEENFGRILAGDLKPYRDELIISTKAGYIMWDGPYGDGGSRKYLLSSLDQSLKRMGIPYVDIFYHHRMDPNTPLEESMMALDTAVKSGKALYAGISNYDREHTAQAMKILKELRCPFVINQSRYSIFDRHIEFDGLKHFAAENGCGIIAFSPLAQGLLTDRYLNGIPADSRIAKGSKGGGFLKPEQLTDTRMKQIRMLHEIAESRGQTLAQMALSWVMRDEEITSVLIGASKAQQILDNLAIIGHLDFTDEELQAIDEISLS
ncbi:aldo/keto reductase [Candidatus Soleaferrea massiliensis]|uniref:aldo/keto reductase n=1 Tax=Candidatus Soleaferrea massiliensis TaxID=1470354 RepID=UPI00058BC763|nr:aldo/keto reductase [Candidatus Soleaferrea massiliensis]